MGEECLFGKIKKAPDLDGSDSLHNIPRHLQPIRYTFESLGWSVVGHVYFITVLKKGNLAGEIAQWVEVLVCTGLTT